jgi:imidazole glycerol phosphate synthase glutamine amidotransferase subunit
VIKFSNKTIGVINHGIGNIRSVTNALEYLGFRTNLVTEPSQLEQSDLVILPGVGNFGGVVDALHSKDLFAAIEKHCQEDRPMIGICVGLQLLFEGSTESPTSKGLNFFQGELRHLRTLSPSEVTPSIGWQNLNYYKDHANPNALVEAYFVHNYFACDVNQEEVVSTYSWHGHEIPAHLGRGRVHGVQFHPEKSRISGLRFIGDLVQELTE